MKIHSIDDIRQQQPVQKIKFYSISHTAALKRLRLQSFEKIGRYGAP